MNTNSPEIVLTNSQKDLIKENCYSLDFNELTKLISGDSEVDGRSSIGQIIKEYMASLGKEPVIPKRQIKGEFILTDHHRHFIETNAKEMRPIEMLKVLFPDILNPSMLCSQGRAIFKYFKEISVDKVYDMWDEPVESQEYKPPVNFQALVGRANAYIPNQINPSKQAFDINNLKSGEERNLRALFAYTKTARFRYQASIYDKKPDRTLFESTFMRYVVDKASELTPEEVDQYIAAAAETINTAKIQRRIDTMENIIDGLLDGIDDNGERKKLSMTHVETVNVLRTKLTDSKKLTHSIVESLAGSRAKRLDNKLASVANMLNLTDSWTQEESRLQLLAIGKMEKEQDANEVKRIKNMSDVKALIKGLSEAEGSG